MALFAALAVFLAAGLGAQAPLASGRVFHYTPGLFAAVAAQRGMALAWGRVDGFASVPDCGRVDVARPWVVRARLAGGPVQRFEVVDCSAPRDAAAQRRKHLVLEVDWASARRAGFAYPPGAGQAAAIIVGYARLR